jgi:hypothetical protein
MITLEAMGVAELLTADPLTCGRAVACQLLMKERRLPDDVYGVGTIYAVRRQRHP